MAVIEEIVEEPTTSRPVDIDAQKIEPVVGADHEGDVFFESEEYPAEELQKLLTEAAVYKIEGNGYFGQGEYPKAIEAYENALLTCPASITKERAIYFGNIAACHLKQGDYKEARDMCTQALTLDPQYHKVLLRRAQANEKLDTSTSLSAALEDYKKLATYTIDKYTQRECQRAEKELPTKIQLKTEKEKEEMMGKLKDLGNTLLGKFGLSTDNFQMQPSEGGGYSMNFVNAPKK